MTTTAEITKALQDLEDALAAADEALGRFSEEHAHGTIETGITGGLMVAMVSFPSHMADFAEQLAKAIAAFNEADAAAK